MIMQKNQFFIKSIIIFSLSFCLATTHSKEVWILVHGTFANKVAKALPSVAWWKPTSHFYKELKASAGKDAVVYSFGWSGENSDEQRKKASKELVDFIEATVTSKDTLFIVGHSHGANVAILCSQELANKKSNLSIAALFCLGCPVSQYYTPNMNSIKKLYSLFSFADFIQPVISLFGRVFKKHDHIHNIQVKIDNISPSHLKLHDPLIGHYLPKLAKLLPDNQDYCIAFFSEKPPVVTLDTKRESDLKLDAYITTQLITSFAESKKCGHKTFSEISQETKARLLRFWNRRSLNSSTMPEPDQER